MADPIARVLMDPGDGRPLTGLSVGDLAASLPIPTLIRRTATAAVPTWSAFIADGASGCRPADPSDPAQRQLVVAVTATGGAVGSIVVGQNAGDLVGPAAGFVAGQTLFVGPGGQLTPTPPSTGWRQAVATVSADGHIVVNIGEATVIADDVALINTGGFASPAATSSARSGTASAEWMAPAATTQHIAGRAHAFTRAQFAAFPVPALIRSLWVHGLTQPGDAPPARYVRGRGAMEIQDALGAWWCLDLSAGRVNVRWFGAKGDVFPLVQCSIAAGSTTLWSGPASFTLADVGKVIEIEGAGAGGGPLWTTIAAVIDGSHVALATPAVTGTTTATTVGRYGTDDAAAVQAALTAALSLTTTQLATLYYPMGRYLHGSQSVGEVPGGNAQLTLYNGLIVEGDGVWATKLYAAQANATGILKIGWHDHKAAVKFRGFQMVSTLDATTAANRGRNNGVGLYIYNPTAAPNSPLNGLHSAVTVLFEHIEVSSDDVNEGSAQTFKGIWHKQIQVDYQFLPTIAWCNFLAPAITKLSELSTFPALTTSSGAVDTDQNAAFVHLKHCYLPGFKGKNFFSGFAKIGIWSEATITTVGLPGRQEGFDATGVEMAGQITGMYFSQSYVDSSGNPAEPDIMQDEIRIIGCQFSSLGADLWFDRWQLVTVSKCHFIFQKQPDTIFGGPFTPAILFSSCSDWTVEGCQFSGGGFSTIDANGNATSSAVSVKVVGASTWGMIKDNRFNHGGMPWYVATTPSMWADAGGQRTIHAAGNQTGGRHNSAWAPTLLSYDPLGLVIESTLAQDANTDYFDSTSRSVSTGSSPTIRNRRLRSDFSFNNLNVQLGSYNFVGLNSTGVEKIAASLFAAWSINTTGAEASSLTVSVMTAGAAVNAVTVDGYSGVLSHALPVVGKSVGFLADNAYDVGSSSNRARNIFAANATIQTSDATQKSGFRPLADAELDAWGEVRPGLFQWRDAVETKGFSRARWHAGYLAQDVRDALVRHGIDPATTALFCEDAAMRWVEKTRVVRGRSLQAVPGALAAGNDAPTMSDLQVGRDLSAAAPASPTVEVHETEDVREETYRVEEPVLDAQGRPVTVLGLRYAECAVWDAAWLRREMGRISDRITAIESTGASPMGVRHG